MTIAYAKTLQSSSGVVESSDGRSSVTERWQFVATDGGVRQKLYPRQLAALQNAGTIPKSAMPYATWLNPSDSWATTSLEATMRLRQAFAVEVPNSNGVLDVQLTWGTRYVDDLDNGIWLPWKGKFLNDLRRTDIWRRLDDCTFPTPSAPGTSDIGGTKIDTNGRPTDGLVYGGVFYVQGIGDARVTNRGNIIADATDYVGRLSSTSLFNFDAYTLLLESYDVEDLEDEYFAMRLAFRFSPVYHCEQVCALDDTQHVVVSSGKATTVYWRRPSNWSQDFSTYWTTFEKFRIEKGLKAYP